MVVNSIKDPSPNQKLLLFWKNKFKDCNTQLTKLPQEEGQHTSVQMQMSCPAQGLSVIYTDGSDVISRVVEFESK
jgi:hypothetical protein